MAGEKSDLSLNCNLADIRFVVGPDLPMVKPRPAKFSASSPQDLLMPGEKLISCGDMPGSIYLNLDERFVRLLLLGLAVVCSINWWLGASGQTLMHTLPWLLQYNWTGWLLVAYLGWLLAANIKKSAYILTDKRLMRVGLFLQIFELSAFDRAQTHSGQNGAQYIELWTKECKAPRVVLHLGEDAAMLAAVFPLALSTGETALPQAKIEKIEKIEKQY